MYNSTADGKRFLLLDESRVRRERLLIYASDLQLDTLFDSHTIYMDGTFSKAPPHFKQVFIIHAINFDICKRNEHRFLHKSLVVLGLPCVFVLMVNKKATSYRRIFFELKQIATDRQKNFSPKVIVSDFESSVLPVVKMEASISCLTKKTRSFLNDCLPFIVSFITTLWMLFPLHSMHL